MNAAYLISLFIILVPGIASAFYYINIGKASISSGAIVTILSLFQFFFRPPPSTFFVGNITWVFQIMVTSVYLLSAIYSDPHKAIVVDLQAEKH